MLWSIKFSLSFPTRNVWKCYRTSKGEFILWRYVNVQTWFPPCPWQTYTPIRAECSGLAPSESRQNPLAGFRTCTNRKQNKVAKQSCLIRSNHVLARQKVGNFWIRIWFVNISPAVSWATLQQNHPQLSSARLLRHKMACHRRLTSQKFIYVLMFFFHYTSFNTVTRSFICYFEDSSRVSQDQKPK